MVAVGGKHALVMAHISALHPEDHIFSDVGGMISQALQAFIDGDADIAQTVLQSDDTVDQMNRDIFVAMDKLMHDNPDVARQALDALLIARNLERVADHATNIAEDVIFWVQGADVRHHQRAFTGRQS